jgi:hypothetical protein
VTFDIARRVTLDVVGADPATERFVTAQMDPYLPGSASERRAGVLIEYAEDGAASQLTELVNPANDGTTTASTASRHCIVVAGRVCALPTTGATSAHFVLDPGFPLSSVFRGAIRPALQLALLDADAVAIHAACVAMDGAAIAVAGWSESGKTETGLALMELGGRFVSDKWTVVGGDATAGTFPINVGVRRWVLDSLPRLRKALPRVARVQLGCAGVAAAVTRPVRGPGAKGRLGRMVTTTIDRGIALADRAALTPTQIAAAYGQEMDPDESPPLGTVVLLSTVPGTAITVDEVDAGWAARRLARSAAYERRGYFELFERSRFATADEQATSFRLAVEQREEAFLAGVLAGVKLLRVRAPFPADPRPIATAILEQSGG